MDRFPNISHSYILISVRLIAPIWDPYILEEETATPDSDWIQRWQAQVASAHSAPQVPSAACNITTPLLLSGWCLLLKGYPHRDMVHFVLNGISEGFRIGFTYKDYQQNKTCREQSLTPKLWRIIFEQS